jgi:hypothetical protein
MCFQFVVNNSEVTGIGIFSVLICVCYCLWAVLFPLMSQFFQCVGVKILRIEAVDYYVLDTLYVIYFLSVAGEDNVVAVLRSTVVTSYICG